MKGKNTNDEKRIPAFSQFFVRMLCAFLLFIFHFGFAGIHFDENAVLDAEEETELSLPDGHEAQNIEPEKAKIYVTEGTTIVNLDENVDVVLIKNLPAEKEIKAEKDLFASSEPKTQKKISTKTEVKTPPSVKYFLKPLSSEFLFCLANHTDCVVIGTSQNFKIKFYSLRDSIETVLQISAKLGKIIYDPVNSFFLKNVIAAHSTRPPPFILHL